ncbi:DUF3330 domain-containing protein [Acidithiobacillus ferrooxidans]|uniref:DUF3330 domain-containing protein n=1 Tax=Acidithiobacillus TaxID=119977 RepID=UPI0027D22F48|nr:MULTISPECIES: DUF3330 domain-containing protein [Acidithiobacillus]
MEVEDAVVNVQITLFTPEGAEYVEHFCGLECYLRFHARISIATEPSACDSPPSG